MSDPPTVLPTPAANTVDTVPAADFAVIGGVIAAVAFITVCLFAVLIRYAYQHKGSYNTNEAKGTEFAESADEALKNDPNFQEAMDESKKQYFI
uniref:Glycophorin-C-like protein n=1 Tax=Callorhinchus milii TaxID=7868 RepID=V9LH50_CALMI